MASPFSIFRKHQRAMIAAVGILCMVAFTIGSVASVENFFMGDRQDPVVVTTRFGDYREADLQDMRTQRTMVMHFLAGIGAKVEVLLRFEQQFGSQMNDQLRAKLEENLQPRALAAVQESFGPPTDSNLVESRVLAAEAKRRGMVIDDAAIDDFLRLETRDQLTGRQFQEVMARLSNRGGRVNKAMLYDALRTELLGMRLKRNFEASLVATPAERWGYYQRLRRRVRIELVPIKAEDFVAEIADPPEQVAAKFFEEYRDQEPQPGSPDPGFKLPHRAAFEFLEAHYNHFFHPEAISDDEVKKFYEQNRDTRYLYNDLAFEQSEVEDRLPQDESDKKDKQADDKQTDDKQPEVKPGEKAPKAPRSADDKPAAKVDSSKEDKPTKEKAAEKPGEKEPDDKPAEKPADDSGSDSSCGADPAESDEPAVADEKPAVDDKPKAEPAADKSPVAPPAPELTAPAQSTPADSVPTEKPQDTSTDQPAATPPTDTPPTGTPPTGTPPATEPGKPRTEAKPLPPQLTERFALPEFGDITKGAKPKYEPLWRVEEAIRKELAGTKAIEGMEKALRGIQEKLGSYSRALSEWEATKREQPDAPMPKPPSFAELAKGAEGITVGDVPLGAEYEVVRAPGIGTSNVRGQPFVSFGFQSVRKYLANISQDNDGNRYLFWKTDDQEGRVPDFQEVRAEVVKVWRLREARKPMRKKADALAEEARKSGKSLKDAFAAQKLPVAEPPAFSWLTVGTAGDFNPHSQPQMSEVADTVDIGPGFMRSVYDLETGDVGVAENNPETIAYVVRMTSSLPSLPVLRQTFLVDKFQTYATVALDANVELYRQWIREQLADAKVHWERKPYDDMRLD